MTEDDRWRLLVELDDELLLGGVTLSEWCAFVVREADTAFAKGAPLAAILTAVAAIETYLRSEFAAGNRTRLVDLIDGSDLPADLRQDLHRLRKYRNLWVHVADPDDDLAILDDPARFEAELDDMAIFAARVLRRTIYSTQGV